MKILKTALLFLFSILLSTASDLHADPERIQVFVSIQPQAYFVERIGGDRTSVEIMVKPGHNPATYEPTPKQAASLAQAKLYFRIGVPFENVWMDRISQVNPTMKIIDTRKNVSLRTMENHYHHGDVDAHEHDENSAQEKSKDPHIWLDPKRVKIQVQTICDALSEIDPTHQSEYEANLKKFHHDLDLLDDEIRTTLKDLRIRRFLVFHPSWGYFADAYDLTQIPIEIEGKEPTARQLAELMELVKQEKIKTVFIQPQFDKNIAGVIAQTIGGSVITLDPLAKDYLKNMKETAKRLQEAMQ
ncbi:MAG: zinc ABC transporter substrate-binding protein [Candidatus Omnitrophica bacterium]|nr:zinc ABC transporter substrate-binding protein [Candidatus Omnitrophota bacterium]